MVNNKTYEFITFDKLMSSVRSEFKSYEDMGLIDDVSCMKVVMKCNEKLGLVFSEMKQVIIPIDNFKGELPIDFYKVFYMAALNIQHFSVTNMVNPWDNTVDQRITYEADIQRGLLGCTENTTVIYKKQGDTVMQNYFYWDELGLAKSKMARCHHLSPIKNVANYVVDFTNENEIVAPFREGEMYMMYLASMRDEEGQTLVPFHPMITNWYEWAIKEKILIDAVMNSDDTNVGDKLKLAQQKMNDAWLDAWNFTTDRTYIQMMADKKARENRWYNQYYRLLK